MFQNVYKNKRVLVTGHSGFKGSWLSEWLASLGADVHGVSLYVPSEPAAFEVLGHGKRFKTTWADVRTLSDMEKVFESFSPQVVFHLAAQPIVSTSYQDPLSTFSTNAIGTANILECIRKCRDVEAGVFVTSDKCYENVEWEYGYREDDKLGGSDPYSASKACAEIVCSSYFRSYFSQNENQPFLATGRAGNVIGGGDWATNRIVPDCMRAWAQKKPVDLRNPKSTRPWQHVLEPLSGYLALGQHLLQRNNETRNTSFNFGPDAVVTQSVGQLIQMMSKHWPGSEYKMAAPTGPAHKEAGLLKLSCDRAITRLQWRPVMTLDETVSMTANWYRKYYSEPNDIAAYTQKQIEEYVGLATKRELSWVR